MDLSRIQFDDKVLCNKDVDRIPLGDILHYSPEGFLVYLKPSRYDTPHLRIPEVSDNAFTGLHSGGQGDNVVNLAGIGWDIDLSSVDLDMAVGHKHPGFVSRRAKTDVINDAVKSHLEGTEEGLSGVPFFLGRQAKCLAELTFENSVNPLHLLLLPKLQSILGGFNAVLAVFARWIRPAINCAFR